MARDYKRRRTTRKKKDQHHWAWLFSGFAMGLVVAWLVHVYHTNQRPGAQQVLAPAPEPVEPLPEETSGPGFDFYELLPDQELVVPDQPAPAGRRSAGSPPPPPGEWFLQVASFTKFEDADRLKANLALIGIQSQIVAWSEGGQTWHRVRVGPTPDKREAERLRTELRTAGMDPLMLRVAE